MASPGRALPRLTATNNMYLKTLTAKLVRFLGLGPPGWCRENREIKVIPNVEANTTVPDFRNFGVQFDPTLGLSCCGMEAGASGC